MIRLLNLAIIPVKKIKIVFMGTPEFALPSLQALLSDDDFEVSCVVTQEDKKVGRKQKMDFPPVKKLALANDIAVLQPEKIKKNSEFIALIKSLAPDFLVVVSYGHILPQKLLDIPAYGAINVHASLLPKYRGASPIQTSLLQGDAFTGITLMKMEEKLDTGGIYFVQKIPVEHQDNAETLRVKLSFIAATVLPAILKGIVQGDYSPLPQNESLATYCTKITKSDGFIDLKILTAEEIFNRVRAYTPWPSTFLLIGNKRIKIIEADFDAAQQIEPGTVIHLSKEKIGFGTKSGVLIPLKIQVEGKKPMPIHEFLKGNKDLLTKLLASPK